MKITRQLRLDALAADGITPIQLTITWEGNRLRMGTGAVVKPEHWDEDQHQVKAKNGTPHASINPRLNRATEAELRRIATLNFRNADTRARLLELRGQVREQSNKREEWSAERWIENVELARDKLLECCYTDLRISDANRAAWKARTRPDAGAGRLG